MRVTSKVVATTPDGEAVIEYQLSSDYLTLRCINYGVTVLSICHKADGTDGEGEELTLNYRTYDELIQARDVPYYGCCVGRVANRIAGGKFSLEDREYTLAVNNGVNHLHGGLVGFDKKLWRSEVIGSCESSDDVTVLFKYTSPDGEEGYPGNLDVSIVYRLTSKNEFIIEYKATSDQMTPINLTNHTYWNISGDFKANIHDHRMDLACSHYLPVDDTQIPLGEVCSVSNTFFDLTHLRSNSTDTIPFKLLGEIIPHVDGGGQNGLDHCFVVDKNDDRIIHSTKSRALMLPGSNSDDSVKLQYVATLAHSQSTSSTSTDTGTSSERKLLVYSTQPAVQVYTGNFLPSIDNSVPDGCTPAAKMSPHCQHNAVCIETQHFPDSINHFNKVTSKYCPPSGHVLRPGDEYYHQTKFHIMYS